MMTTPVLVPRSVPVQKRSRSRVQKVLDVTERLVLAHGYDSLNTNFISDESGIPIGTLYHYYSNKYAIFADIIKRSFAELEQKWQEQAPADPARESIHEYLDRILDMMAEHWRRRRAAMHLWNILKNTPEVKPVTDRFLKITVQRNVATLRHYFPRMPVGRCELIATVMEDAGSGLLNRMNSFSGAQREALLTETKALIGTYLDTLAS